MDESKKKMCGDFGIWMVRKRKRKRKVVEMCVWKVARRKTRMTVEGRWILKVKGGQGGRGETQGRRPRRHGNAPE